jgi:uracil-DNA glycosylase family 4
MSSSWAESALSWWEEAGVDTIVGETPRDWLAIKPKAQMPAAPAAPLRQPETAPLAFPAELDGFQSWFVDGSRLPLAAPGAPRIGPSGDPQAGLMVMVDMPAAADFQTSALLSGEAGALFDRMLAAIGRSRETIYLASLSPLRTPAGTLDGALAEHLAAIARHHIGLVAPRALLLFGDTCAKALTGEGVVGARQRWHHVATDAGRIRTLVTIRPEKLLTQKALKTHAWADLQMLREELKA